MPGDDDGVSCNCFAHNLSHASLTAPMEGYEFQFSCVTVPKSIKNCLEKESKSSSLPRKEHRKLSAVVYSVHLTELLDDILKHRSIL